MKKIISKNTKKRMKRKKKEKKNQSRKDLIMISIK